VLVFQLPKRNSKHLIHCNDPCTTGSLNNPLNCSKTVAISVVFQLYGNKAISDNLSSSVE